MSLSSRLPNGVRRLVRLPRSRARLLDELDDEMRAHLAMRIEHLRMLGMSARDAEIEALRRFGDTAEYRTYAARRVARKARWYDTVEWLEGWLQDVRFANRQFCRNVAFTVLAVGTLALGIGANTAIFTVAHRLLIAPLPYADGDRIVKLVVEQGENLGAPTPEMRAAWRDGARSLEMIAAVSVDALYLQDFGEPQDSIPAYVTSNYLTLLGLHPALGRAFVPEDEHSRTVAMISYGKWQREYGGRANVLGSTVKVGPPVHDRWRDAERCVDPHDAGERRIRQPASGSAGDLDTRESRLGRWRLRVRQAAPRGRRSSGIDRDANDPRANACRCPRAGPRGRGTTGRPG